jgi:hypothetical protein
VFRFWLGLFKLVTASLLAGAAMSALDFSAADLLANLGLTPERVIEHAQRAWAWALPNIMLGSFVILPVWLVAALLRPPRARD